MRANLSEFTDFSRTDGKNLRDFSEKPNVRCALHSVFLAAAVSQRYGSRRLTFLQKRRYAQIEGAGAKCDFACARFRILFANDKLRAQNAVLLARMRVRAHGGSGAKTAARAERNRGEGVLRRALT